MKRYEMVEGDKIELKYREYKPRVHAMQIVASRPDGLPDGVHCGAWLDLETDTVWKLLYGRPFINADYLYRTKEDTFLSLFKHLPFLPMNWEVKASNHLWWLVRDKAIKLQPDEYKHLDNARLLEIEKTIRKVNSEGWALNDYITLLFDQKVGEYFIADASTACPDSHADDTFHIERFFNLCGREHLNQLRKNARTQLHNLRYGKDQNLQEFIDFKGYDKSSYKHVYASYSRPISPLWASLPASTCFKHEDYPGRKDGEFTPFTWVITQEELPDEKVKSYELTWGWSTLQG